VCPLPLGAVSLRIALMMFEAISLSIGCISVSLFAYVVAVVGR
jgi:hypothetical protein